MVQRAFFASLCCWCCIITTASAGAVLALAGLVVGVVAGRLSRPKVWSLPYSVATIAFMLCGSCCFLSQQPSSHRLSLADETCYNSRCCYNAL